MDSVLLGGGAQTISSSTARSVSAPRGTKTPSPGAGGLTGLAGPKAPATGIRQAGTGASAIVVKAGPDGDPPLATALRDTLSRIFQTLNRGNPEGAEAATERAFAAFGKLLDSDAGRSASGIEIKIVSQSVGVDDADSGRRSGLFLEQLALEVGFVRDNAVHAEDTRLLKLDGREIELDDEARRDGVSSGRYVRKDTASGKAEDRASKALDAAREALERIREVQDALAAYREGDLRSLKSLIDGTLGQTRGFEIGV